MPIEGWPAIDACAVSLPDTQDPKLLVARCAQYLAYLTDEPLAMAERLLA